MTKGSKQKQPGATYDRVSAERLARQRPDYWCGEWLDVDTGPNKGTRAIIWAKGGHYWWEFEPIAVGSTSGVHGPFPTSQAALDDIFGETE